MSVAPKLNWAARLESWKGMVAAVMLVTGGDWSSVNTLESCSLKPAQALSLRRRTAHPGCMPCSKSCAGLPCRTCCKAEWSLTFQHGFAQSHDGTLNPKTLKRLAPAVVVQIMDRAG